MYGTDGEIRCWWLTVVLFVAGIAPRFGPCGRLVFVALQKPSTRPEKAEIWSGLWSYKPEPHEKSWVFKIFRTSGKAGLHAGEKT